LLIDGSERMRTRLAAAMEKHGYRVAACRNAKSALLAVETIQPRYAVTELKLPDACGLKLMSMLKAAVPGITLVVHTGYASIASAIKAIKLGAVNYLIKPASPEQIIAALTQRDNDEREPPYAKPLSIDRLEWEYINMVMHDHDGNLSSAARALSMHRRTLQRKLTKCGARS